MTMVRRPTGWQRKLLSGLLLHFTVAAGWRAARASILVALDLPALVKRADHIAVVEVSTVRTAWDEKHERIYSTIELKVIENWKSPSAATASPDRLTIVQPGGTVGDIKMTVTGMGTFAAGERSLVFLHGPADRAQVVGMTQGKRPMKFEPASRRWLVTPPDLRQTKLVLPAATQTPTPKVSSSAVPAPATSTTPIRRELPLDDFRVEVKKLLGPVQP
jgi:hypothetical protein